MSPHHVVILIFAIIGAGLGVAVAAMTPGPRRNSAVFWAGIGILALGIMGIVIAIPSLG